MSSSLRTLVVEDEPSTRLFIREVLHRRGHEVQACADAESAWEVAQGEVFSLAVLDMTLPGMDGSELCRKLRKLPYGDELVVVFVTGADSVDDLGRALDAGADDYILKPVVEANLPVRFALIERRIHFLHDRKRTEEGLLQDALKDSVTDLVNRTLFFEQLQRTARRAGRENEKSGRAGRYLYAVVILNLDGFGEINARFGYPAGDGILREVGQRLEDCIRSGDTVARFGGDEFIILLDDMRDATDPMRVILRIEEMFATPFVVEGEEVRLSACAGSSLELTGGADPVKIVEEARSALVRAKEEGPGTHRINDPEVHARASAQVRLESRLSNAVENGEMELYYQPIVRGNDGRVAGFEALVRWNDPERGMVPPNEFVGLAEDTGAILSIGRWVIEDAARQLAAWNAERDEDDNPLFMSINVSGRQFAHSELVQHVADAVGTVGVSPQDFHIEITETALMTDLHTAGEVIRKLKDAKMKIYVDDFGTGYSSLSYLCRLPLDGLKIDRSFVAHMTDSRENWEVVRTIAQLAGSLSLQVVAEGVETDHQLEELRKLSCEYVQGYLFGRPSSAGEATELLQANRRTS